FSNRIMGSGFQLSRMPSRTRLSCRSLRRRVCDTLSRCLRPLSPDNIGNMTQAREQPRGLKNRKEDSENTVRRLASQGEGRQRTLVRLLPRCTRPASSGFPEDQERESGEFPISGFDGTGRSWSLALFSATEGDAFFRNGGSLSERGRRQLETEEQGAPRRLFQAAPGPAFQNTIHQGNRCKGCCSVHSAPAEEGSRSEHDLQRACCVVGGLHFSRSRGRVAAESRSRGPETKAPNRSAELRADVG